MSMRITARQKAIAASEYWRTIMRRKSAIQVLLVSMSPILLTVWAGAQSTQGAATPLANAGSSSAVPTEEQEMRDELRALRAEVEPLRAEVERPKSTAPADTARNDQGGVATIPTG